MEPLLEELDYRPTPLGDLILQRRRLLALGGAVAYEVRLGDDYLMSSLFHEAEEQLAHVGLAALAGRDWEVVVGGLGLGYTAAAALEHPEVARLVVVEALEPVIDWHRQGLVPNGARLTDDPRCVYLHGDFFAMARGEGFDPERPGRRFDAVLLDVDHTPGDWLDPSHGELYSSEGLRRLQRFLKPGGVFALWSNDPPEEAFLETLRGVFAEAEGRVIEFPNPMQGGTAVNGLYLAKRASGEPDPR